MYSCRGRSLPFSLLHDDKESPVDDNTKSPCLEAVLRRIRIQGHLAIYIYLYIYLCRSISTSARRRAHSQTRITVYMNVFKCIFGHSASEQSTTTTSHCGIWSAESRIRTSLFPNIRTSQWGGSSAPPLADGLTESGYNGHLSARQKPVRVEQGEQQLDRLQQCRE